MKLVPIADEPMAVTFLFRLLKERRPEQSISHKRMPTWAEHCAFVASKPYEAWYLVCEDGHYVGSIYLTRNREIGVFIRHEHHGQGYGYQAIQLLREMHAGRLLANVNPANQPSRRIFERVGGRVIQMTYEIPATST